MGTKATKRDNGNGCIVQRKDGRWEARLQIGTKDDGKPRIKSLYGKTESDVKKKLREYKIETAKGIYEVSKINLSNYTDNWLKTYKYNSLKRSSYDRLENTYNHHIKDTIGYIQMGNITTHDIQKLLNEKSNTLSFSSIKKIYELLNPLFKHAILLGDIKKNPMLGVIMPKKKDLNVQTKEIDIYSDEDIDKLIKTINSTFTDKCKLYRYSPIYIVLLNTGIRMGEALSIKWDQVNFNNKTLRIRENISYVKSREDEDNDNKRVIIFTDTKTKNGNRVIPLNSKAIEALKEIRRRNEIQNINSEYVVSDLNGNYVLPRNFSRTLEMLCNRAGVKFVGTHATRHTFASNAIRKGIDVKIVSEILGHSNIQLTYNRYVHIIQEQKMAAVQVLEAL
ncbi:MAG: site-specific integrase [Anaerocolumna sp.]|jgi:integrase|nr:site-specific integrase [Anaerocolumna sp.]